MKAKNGVILSLFATAAFVAMPTLSAARGTAAARGVPVSAESSPGVPADEMRPGGAPGTVAEIHEYARREAAAPELGEFSGGSHVLVLALLVVAILIFVALITPW